MARHARTKIWAHNPKLLDVRYGYQSIQKWIVISIVHIISEIFTSINYKVYRKLKKKLKSMEYKLLTIITL